MLLTRTVLAALTLACAGCTVPHPAASVPPPFAAPEPTVQSLERGRVLATARCASCHAVGPAGDSPMVAAPPFRDIATLYPPDQLQEALAEGIMTGHPAMPQFEFQPAEINDLIAYLDSLRTR